MPRPRSPRAQRNAGQTRREGRQEAREARQEARAVGEARQEARETARDTRQATRQNIQATRAADFGLWFNTRGNEGLVIDDLDNGLFATAGFREGDIIVSVNGQPVTPKPSSCNFCLAPTSARSRFRSSSSAMASSKRSCCSQTSYPSRRQLRSAVSIRHRHRRPQSQSNRHPPRLPAHAGLLRRSAGRRRDHDARRPANCQRRCVHASPSQGRRTSRCKSTAAAGPAISSSTPRHRQLRSHGPAA